MNKTTIIDFSKLTRLEIQEAIKNAKKILKLKEKEDTTSIEKKLSKIPKSELKELSKDMQYMDKGKEVNLTISIPMLISVYGLPPVPGGSYYSDINHLDIDVEPNEDESDILYEKVKYSKAIEKAKQQMKRRLERFTKKITKLAEEHGVEANDILKLLPH
jgi:hypothetical protein